MLAFRYRAVPTGFADVTLEKGVCIVWMRDVVVKGSYVEEGARHVHRTSPSPPFA